MMVHLRCASCAEGPSCSHMPFRGAQPLAHAIRMNRATLTTDAFSLLGQLGMRARPQVQWLEH